ncbi:MAG: hypothetical protein QOG75_2878, partial [Mycobacterium sp.]|nr:hypothetical protein [Mycobacterium sp.]
EAKTLIERDALNAEVLFPFVNGEDLNSRPDSSAGRWIINFFDWSEERAQQYPDCYSIVRHKVKPDRDRSNGESYRRYWWRYGRSGVALYKSIDGLSYVLAIALVSKIVLPVRVPAGQVFSHQTAVFATDDAADLALLSSAPHYWWAITHASTLETRIRYTPSDVFDTFARPVSTDRMRIVGEELDRDRRDFMLGRQLGLTQTYNLIHEPAVADTEVAHLRALHAEIDEAVCAAYGWDDLLLDHSHYDTRQGVRWTVSPAARLELLDRLLELNHSRYAEEQAASTAAPVRRKRRGKSTAQPAEGTLFDTDEDA